MRFLSSVAALAFAFLSGSAGATTTYVLSRDSANVLRVEVTRPEAAPATTLVLRGAKIAMGIHSQVVHPTCDGRDLASAPEGATWQVPAGCRLVTWTVVPEVAGAHDASASQSMIAVDGSNCLFSEASSLPRLADASAPELLSVAHLGDWQATPAPGTDGTLTVPETGQAPLFVILGAHASSDITAGGLRLLYFLDDPAALAKVASAEATLRGLQWLTGLAPAAHHVEFDYYWMGLAGDAPSFGGATGRGVMLANYPRDVPAHPAMAMVTDAIPLIEGTHRIAESYPNPSRPAWVEESLAVYFGARALRYARPDTDESAALLAEFEKDATRFAPGLIEIQRQIHSNHRELYGAFFTKGVAFWDAVDQAMKAAGSAGLEVKLPQVWMAQYGRDGSPPADFARMLGLSQPAWQSLQDRFLGS